MDLNEMAQTAGQQALLSIIVELFAIVAAWIVLQEVKLEPLLRRPRSVQARILQIMLAVVIGHLFAGFLIDYWKWSGLLRGLVE
ncbi:DUF1146 family protein [Paenibacillus oenotherae]|uniref:DUF1146 family protein n=1 Tax=Paenibacillus oenotherae TaxID=1435645 RepID=A0ABS7D5C9_9BACL|nr:DUF1146 family protein [Paenibacillus oenotherae]MBW7475031.1 DUF1146 family protein [Paenibacillus oenotherae]